MQIPLLLFIVNIIMLAFKSYITHRKKRFSLLTLVLMIGGSLSGCQQDKVAHQLQSDPYFDLKGLIDQQIAILDSLNPPIAIKAQIGDKEEQITTYKDSSAWRASLKLFTDADINQPVLQGTYMVKDSMDNRSGLKIKVYQAKHQNHSNIPYLKVYYQDSLPNVRHIETVFQEHNMLYTTQRKMSADFDSYHGKPRMIQYKTLGKQKMLLKDSVLYAMQAKIAYPS